MKRRMRRKILAILTTVAMVLSLAPSALAGPFSDVPDNHQYAGAINRLAELGVLEGVGGGKYDPEGTYTRAQFAALVTKLMGLKSAADASKGATDFKDVPADHWASGYVNVASSMGIVKGYGDGTFKPDKLVNHAEALTMLVRALGYEPVLKGKWPANVMVKAAELGLTSGVTVVANLPASRGEVAQFSNNAVDVPMLVQSNYGDQVTYCVSGTTNCGDRKTLLASSVTGKVIDGQLVETGAIVGSGLADDEVTINVKKVNGKDASGSEAGDHTYKLGAGFSAAVADMLGEDVKATVREIGGDSVIIGLSSTNGSKFVVKRVHAKANGANNDDLTDDTLTLGSSSDNKQYSFASGAKVWYQGAPIDGMEDVMATGDDVRAKVLLDSSNKVKVAVIYNYSGARIVSSVNTTNKSVAWLYPASTTTGVKDVDLTIVRNGKIVGLGDLQKGDVVYNLTGSSWPSNGASGNFVWIAVNKGTVTGNLGGISSDLSTVNIGGNNVDGVGTGMASSKDDGKTFNTGFSAAKELVGQSVTGYLDAIGRVLAMVSSAGTAAAANEKYGLIYEIKTATSGLDTKTYIRLWNSAGSKQDLVVTKDTKLYADPSTVPYTVWSDSELQDGADDAAVIDTGAEKVASALGYNPATNSGATITYSRDSTTDDGYRLVKYTLTSSGELETVRDMDRGTGRQNDKQLGFNKDTNRVSYDGTTGVASSSTIVFQTAETTPAAATSDIKMGTWDGIKKTTTPMGRYVVDSDGKVLVIVLTYETTGLAAAVTTGIMTAAPMLTGTDTYTIYVDEAGTAKTYSAKESDWTVKDAAGNPLFNGINDPNVKKGAVVVVEPKAGGGYTLTLKEVTPRSAFESSTANGSDGVQSVGTDNVKVTGTYTDSNGQTSNVANQLYWTAAGVNVYDTRNDQVRKVSLTDLQSLDDVFMQFNSDGDVELIKIK